MTDVFAFPFSQGCFRLLPVHLRFERGESPCLGLERGRGRTEPGQLHRLASPEIPPQRTQLRPQEGAGLYQGGHRREPKELSSLVRKVLSFTVYIYNIISI